MFKKLFDWIKSLVSSDTIEDIAIEKIISLANDGLEKFYAKDPVKATALVQSVYAWIPTLAELAADTKPDLDDKGVEAVKKEIEEFAAAHGIDLVDQAPNDEG